MTLASIFAASFGEVFNRAYSAFAWPQGAYDMPDEPDFVTKVHSQMCWRAGCLKPEASDVGLCAFHLEEARSWSAT